eukprot:1477506-Rhodomonas_salina.1
MSVLHIPYLLPSLSTAHPIPPTLPQYCTSHTSYPPSVLHILYAVPPILHIPYLTLYLSTAHPILSQHCTPHSSVLQAYVSTGHGVGSA